MFYSGHYTRVIRYRDDIDAARAAARRQQLLDSLTAVPFDDQYEVADPQVWNRLSFRPRDVGSDYLSWPTLPELATLDPVNGLMEKRSGALIDIDRDALASRMRTYFDKALDWPSFKLTAHPLATDAARYDAEKTRKKALAAESYDSSRLVRYIVRPFDVQHAYFSGLRPIWNEPRPQLWAQYSAGNQFLMTRRTGAVDPEGPPTFFTECLADDHCLRTDAFLLPVQNHLPAQGMFDGITVANLSDAARTWLKHLNLPDPDADPSVAAAPWHHALAITFAPQYLDDNADGIAIDWPRVPLPASSELLDRSATLGARVAALLDTGSSVPGVTAGTVGQHLQVIGAIAGSDLSVSAGWGSRDRRGRVNPGRGKTEAREWTEAERAALQKGLASEDIPESRGLSLLGGAVDVYLNDTNYWRGVPASTWEYVIGGYLVTKKWLSYRENVVLGRALTKDEAREVTAIVRRLTALVLLSDELDANYVACRDNAYSWPAP